MLSRLPPRSIHSTRSKTFHRLIIPTHAHTNHLHRLFFVYTDQIYRERTTRKANGLCTISERSTHNKRTEYAQQANGLHITSEEHIHRKYLRRAAHNNTKKWSERLDVDNRVRFLSQQVPLRPRWWCSGRKQDCERRACRNVEASALAF
jgi:hypothetical protein